VNKTKQATREQIPTNPNFVFLERNEIFLRLNVPTGSNYVFPETEAS